MTHTKVIAEVVIESTDGDGDFALARATTIYEALASMGERPRVRIVMRSKSDTEEAAQEEEQRCRVCGCTNETPCVDDAGQPCWWVGDDLCSHCEYKQRMTAARAERESLQVETDDEVLADRSEVIATMPADVRGYYADDDPDAYTPPVAPGIVEQVDAEVAAISEATKAVLGPEHVDVTPLKAPDGNGGIKYKWPGYYNETERLEHGRDFSMLPRTTRVELVELCGKQIAADILEPPTMTRWDELKPAWMPGAAAVQQSYLRDVGWKERARQWHLHAKGLA